MQIEGLRKYQRRNSRGACFAGLPPDVRGCAHRWLERFVSRRRARGKLVRGWVFGILVGQAKRLALHPPTSEWGRSMRARKGGYAVQRKYTREGRNPTDRATFVRLVRGGHAQSAREFVEAPRDAALSKPGVPNYAPRSWVVPGRPGAPPMTVTVGRKPDQLLPHLHPQGCQCDYCGWPHHEP